MEHILLSLPTDGFLPRHVAAAALADLVLGGADDPLRLGVFAKRLVQPRPATAEVGGHGEPVSGKFLGIFLARGFHSHGGTIAG